ncbi:MAG: hypothetical protein H8D78_05805 [Chloroflexi bacterium]|nr:hypothetical protein [Chloroflexota bacterium]
MSYDTLTAIAEYEGVRPDDLLVLAKKNDPWGAGSTPGLRRSAEWFAGLWRAFGYTRGVHLRRVHYQLVSQEQPVLLPNGKPYQNTENCWNYLCEAGKQARYQGLVAAEAFVDRRNPDPLIHRSDRGWLTGGSWEWDLAEWDFPQVEVACVFEADLARPTAEAWGYEGVQELQPYLLEVWAEKTTMNDVLEPLCRRYQANLITGMGFMSITAVVDLLERIRQIGKPGRIFYISDYDPAGYGMPIAVARQVEFWAQGEGLDVALTPLVLTADQVAQFRLPRAPVKSSDRRKAGWVATHGAGAVELDALEALYPGELAGIVSRALARYHDATLDHQAEEQRWALQRAARLAVREATEPFLDELGRLEDEIGLVTDGYRPQIQLVLERLEDLRAEMQEELAPLIEEAEDLRAQMQSALEDIDLDPDRDYPLPEPEVAGDDDEPLFSTRRDYLDQLAAYQAHQGNGGGI